MATSIPQPSAGGAPTGGKAWTGAHQVWLHQLRREGLAGGNNLRLLGTLAAFDADLEAVEFALARRDRLDAAIAGLAADSEFTDVTRRLACLRGVSTLTGFALAVEIGDWTRLDGSSIGAYLGLVPSEHSSGGHRSLGGITKAGNSHVRRLLVEAAWHHKPTYVVGKVLHARWDLATPAARARAHAGNQRLHPPLDRVRAPPQEAHRGHHRDRPRTGRLVLVPGHPRRRPAAPAGTDRHDCLRGRPKLLTGEHARHGSTARSTRDSAVSQESPPDARPQTTADRSRRTHRPAVTNPTLLCLVKWLRVQREARSGSGRAGGRGSA